MKTREGVIVFVIKDDRVLLAKKTRVLGIGKWNGYGGGFEPEQDIDFHACAVREFGEECKGATIQRENLTKVGFIHFHNGDKFEFKAHVFIADDINGEPQSSEEMTEPTWFSLSEIPPSEDFMDSDKHWIPRILAGEMIKGNVWYDGEFRLTERGVEITVVDSF